jgi:SAM-dependent methyltransferase
MQPMNKSVLQIHHQQNMETAQTEVLHSSVPPIPPAPVRNRTGGGDTAERHLHSGTVNWFNLAKAFEDSGHVFSDGQKVLEFGCGGGRILRHFASYHPGLDLYGVDIDYGAINWCQENLPFATFTVGETDPPLAMQDEQFEAIYAFSVFSHLPEKRHLDWLRELARISKPGATVALTKMGQNCFDLYSTGQRPKSHPYPDQLEGKQAVLDKDGFVFVPLERANFSSPESRDYFATVDLEQYGGTFISDTYVRRVWSEFFDVVEIYDAPDKWQDIVVLKRR